MRVCGLRFSVWKMSNGQNEFEIITKTVAAAFEPKKTRKQDRFKSGPRTAHGDLVLC